METKQKENESTYSQFDQRMAQYYTLLFLWGTYIYLNAEYFNI